VALVALAPGVTLIAVKSDGEYEKLHSSPAGALTAELNERLRATLPPTSDVPEDRAKETCADDPETAARRRTGKSINRAGRSCRMFISTEFHFPKTTCASPSARLFATHNRRFVRMVHQESIRMRPHFRQLPPIRGLCEEFSM
jgi:hypothetical protein